MAPDAGIRMPGIAADRAQEQVPGAAQLRVAEIGQARAQETPQRHQVDQVLQVVVLGGDGLLQLRFPLATNADVLPQARAFFSA